MPALPAGLSYVQASSGNFHTVALRSDGSVVAWGKNDYGQCAVPPLPSGLTYVEVDAGGHMVDIDGHSIARRSDGSVVGWGSSSGAPPAPSGLSYVAISAGESHNLALRSDGQVVRWGDCFYPAECTVPVLPSGLTYVAVAAGWAHNVALRSDGAIVAWGSNQAGQCDPPRIGRGMRVVELAAGTQHAVARLEGCATCEVPFCLGDGGIRSEACPCRNFGVSGHGCENSASTGGAQLSARGSVEPDRVVLSTIGTPSSVPSLFLQGSSVLEAARVFGDGLRCIGGNLKRLGIRRSSYPSAGDPSISARSAALGDLIAPGSLRYYQALYRDFSPRFCSPATFNSTNAVMVAW